MDRLDHGVRDSCQEAIDQMRAGNGLRLGAPLALEFGPDAREREQRAVIIEREPHDVFLFGIGAGPSLLKPAGNQKAAAQWRRNILPSYTAVCT